MSSNKSMEKATDIFVADLNFFGYQAPAIAWMALAGSAVGLAFAVAYIGGLNNARKKG